MYLLENEGKGNSWFAYTGDGGTPIPINDFGDGDGYVGNREGGGNGNGYVGNTLGDGYSIRLWSKTSAVYLLVLAALQRRIEDVSAG
jgi:hypothetical protein